MHFLEHGSTPLFVQVLLLDVSPFNLNVVDWKKNPSSSPCKDQWDEAGVESVDLVVRGGRDLKLQNCKQES